ncbi:MAG TPA: hypothetical protein PKN64_07355 [Casimicrobium sp.]|jgi:hypothetical protein|nr:hypothetical protein [Casimicrobium sp.]
MIFEETITMPNPDQILFLPDSHELRRRWKINYVWTVKQSIGVGQPNRTDDVRLFQSMMGPWLRICGRGYNVQSFSVRPTGVFTAAEAFWIYWMQTKLGGYRGRPDGVVSPLNERRPYAYFVMGLLNETCLIDSTVNDDGRTFAAGYT